MKNTLKVNETEVNFDVLNALNLHHPQLGEAYSNFGWNPLGENFSLDIPFIEKYLESARYKPEEKAPAFLEKDPKKVFEAFKTASKNNKEMLASLKEKLEKGEFKNVKGADITPQVKDILFFLECRQKMLDISIGQLSSNKIGALKAYQNINSINRKLSQLLEEAYLKEFNKNVALGNMLLQAQLQHKHQNTKTTEFSNVFNNLLGKNFSPNQTFTPVDKNNKSFLEQINENVASMAESVKDMAEKFVEGVTENFVAEHTAPTPQKAVAEPTNDFKLSNTQTKTQTQKESTTPTQTHNHLKSRGGQSKNF